MKGILLIVVTLVTYAYSTDVGYNASIAGMKGIEIKCDNESQHKIIKSYKYKPGYDFLKFSSNVSKPIQVLVDNATFPDFKTVLAKENVSYNIVHDDFRKVIVDELDALKNLRFKRELEPVNSYLDYDKIVKTIYEYSSNRPMETSVVQYGRSYEGRELLGLKFSWGSNHKPAVIIEGGLHARDWISVATALNLANALIKIENLHVYKDIDIYIFPLINPDGYEYSRLSPDTRLWKKTRSQYPNSNNCFGTDIDRNFDVYWNTIGGSTDPCSDNYSGPYVVSEPETQAYAKYINSKKNIKAYLSLRSFGNKLVYPYAYSFKSPKNLDILRCILDEAKVAIHSVRQSDYEIDNFAVFVDQMAGTSIDWMMMKGGAKTSFLMDLSPKNFQFTPPPSELRPITLEAFKFLEILLLYAEGDLCNNLIIEPPYDKSKLLYNYYTVDR